MTGKTTYASNGCKMYLREAPRVAYSYKRTMECYDIDIDPRVDDITFDDKLECKIIDLKNCFKQFPNVKTIRIAKNIAAVKISNFMFPNVNMVYSDSYNFLSEVSYLANYKTLYNAFCKGPDAVLDMKKITAIEPDALEGCRASLVNVSPSITIVDGSVDGSSYVLEPANPLTCIGDTVVSVDDSQEFVTLPPKVKQIPVFFKLPSDSNLRISISNIPVILAWSKAILRKNSININKLFIDVKGGCVAIQENLSKLFRQYNGFRPRYVEVSDNPYVSSRDGVIYSKDGKKLLYCPVNRTGKFVVPDGVEEIAGYAFYKTKISEIVCSDSVKKIGDSAFALCDVLNKADLNSVERIGVQTFYSCKALKKVNLGNRLRYIGESCFNNCNRLNILSFPASIERVGQYVSHYLAKLYFQGDSLPEGLFNAVCANFTVNEQGYSNIAECEMRSGRKFFIPTHMATDNADALDLQLELFGVTESLDFLYQYAEESYDKYQCAVLSYKESHNVEVGKYLSRVATKVVEAFLDNEDRLIEFLKLGLASENALNGALKKVRDKNFASAEAYILNALKDSKTKSFRV